MELHQLRYFCAIADTGSFSRAAQQTHVSQPSLSQQIGKLEDELGTRLFDRLGRSVRLTELGKSFLPRAQAVLRDLESARNDIVEKKTSITGLISVGVIPTIAPYFLPSILATFSRKWPLAHFTVVEEITQLLLEKLRAGAVDVAIVALPVRVRNQEFESFPLMTEKLFAVLPKMCIRDRDTGTASGGKKKARLASGLVVAQISLSLLLLICAGLFIRSFLSAQQINPGFNAHNVMIASYDVFTSGYSDERLSLIHI